MQVRSKHLTNSVVSIFCVIFFNCIQNSNTNNMHSMWQYRWCAVVSATFRLVVWPTMSCFADCQKELINKKAKVIKCKRQFTCNKYLRKIKLNLPTKVGISISTYSQQTSYVIAPPGERRSPNCWRVIKLNRITAVLASILKASLWG